jgi:hypothetical protein
MAQIADCRPEFFEHAVKAKPKHPLIMLPYTPSVRPQEQDRAMKSLAHVLNEERVPATRAVPAICRLGEEFAYWGWLRTCWDMARSEGADLLVVEHDIQLTQRAYRGLVECPEPWCAGIYVQKPPRAPEPVFVARVNQGPWHEGPMVNGVLEVTFPDDPPRLAPRWLKPGERWADSVGLGCTRMRPDRPWPLPNPVPWGHLDSSLCHALKVRWHIHWPALAHGL